MTTGDFARLEALFAEAAEADPAVRARLLETACADRPDLRLELDALWRAHDHLRLGEAAEAVPADVPQIGDRLGAFRLVDRIGDGGMGTVFRAERDDGVFQAVVAVKVVRATLVSSELRQRFTLERQILASLQHPSIVTLLDGGTTPAGHAYLVMEFVNGPTIDRYCREQGLSLDRRLRLFRVLCDAAHYAHQRGVVHRDLKPGNVIVREDGTPKVLDFGIARMLDADPAQALTHSPLAGPLTPNYASPEQLRGLPVTSASDVYSLGVMLYEMVSDARPYDTTNVSLDRVMDLVVHTEPPRPSSASGRRTLRGDVDAIVMKALRKDPAERYSSAAELGADIGRFLAREPILARAPSTGYVLRRLASRNRSLVIVSALALAGILATTGVALWQWRVARREQTRAEAGFRDTRRLANTLMFKIHDAVAPLAGSTPVRRAIVDEALSYLERLEREAGDGDETLRVELAAAYRQIAAILGDPQTANLGDRDGAVRQYERARAILTPLVARDDAPYDTVREFTRVSAPLGTIYGLRGDSDRARAIAKAAVVAAEGYRARHPQERRALDMLAAARFTDAWATPANERAARWRETLADYEQLLALEPQSPNAQRNVALVEKYLAEFLPTDEAELHYRRAVQLDESRVAGAPGNRQAQLDAAISVAGLGRVLEKRERLDEALRMFERSVAIRRSVVDSDPADVRARDRLGIALSDLARVQFARGGTTDARQSAQDSIRILEAVTAVTQDQPAQGRLAYAYFELGRAEQGLGDKAAACRAFRSASTGFAVSTPDWAVDERAVVTREVAACDRR
jgi:non-specific serine/threonine protein kinase/serine/threonine-protein kinase